MRRWLSFLLLFPGICCSQRVDWHHASISLVKVTPLRNPSTLSAIQQRRLNRLLAHDPIFKSESGPAVSADGVPRLQAHALPLGQPEIYAVEDICGNHGCGYWIVRLDAHPRLFGSFDGWGYWPQLSSRHILHDFVAVEHLGADQFELVYYRFNGREYRRIGSDIATRHAEGQAYRLSDGTPIPDATNRTSARPQQ